MAVYRIFPHKSSTLYSYYPDKNTGLDEILEISLFDNQINNRGEVSRAVIKFDTDDINNVFSTLVGNNSYSASLKLYLATAEEIPLDYTLLCYPISGTWDMGTGRSSTLPSSSNGISWLNRNITTNWVTSSFGANVTASYSTSSYGGGNWYYNHESTQSFTFSSTKDIEFNVTDALTSIISSSIQNEGFIIKHSSSLEFQTGSVFELKYFSGNTHTIYPPCLEIKWDDFSYVTGSGTVISNDRIVATIANNKEIYSEDSVERFRINVRDRFPARSFQTSSVYLTNKFLPTSSYWSIKDVDSNEIVVDYDETFTKICADSTSNYFDIYMNGLQVERWYKILLKTSVSGNTVVLDNDYLFKITQ